MTPYGKVYKAMFEGSLYGTSALHLAMMAYVIANQVPDIVDGEAVMVVDLNPALLGGIMNEGVERVKGVIEDFCGPDPESRTKAEGGRRLVRVGQFRYRVVNGMMYRRLAEEEKRREVYRKAKARTRAIGRAWERGMMLEGEKEYVAAVDMGAGREQLDKIIEKWLPKRKKVGEEESAVES